MARMWRAWLLVILVGALANASPPDPRDVNAPEPRASLPRARRSPRAVVPAAQLENSCIDGTDAACKRHALDGFAEALASQRAGSGTHPLRISYIGDSLTADDQITNQLRTKIGAMVGDGGPGFAFAVAPHPYCQHRAVTRVVNGTWRVHGVSSAAPPDHLLGLGGSAETDTGGSIRLVTRTAVTHVDIHYLAQPRGGAFEVIADGTSLGTVETAAEHKQAAFSVLSIPDGARKIELRTHRKVRLFGATLEGDRGVVVDNLGIVNATAKQMTRHNLVDHLRNQLAHRASDLVIVMLGTNEAEWIAAKGAAMKEHEQVYGDLLATIRTANPTGSCLVISPLDQTDVHQEGMPPRDSIPAMVEAQRRAARANGCAFWDTYQWMGGKGASKQWNQRGLMMKDFQHPTTAGANRLADALFDGLVR
jgi:lysophospholipase L1-like esterase